MAKSEYVKGTVTHVIAKDSHGFPTNYVERDSDGQHWHIKGDADPEKIDADEIQSLAAEHESTGGKDRDE